MSILMVGTGPLPFYKNKTVTGLGIGTWQYVKAFLDANMEVHLATFEWGSRDSVQIEYNRTPETLGLKGHLALPEPDFYNMKLTIKVLSNYARSVKPKCIMAVSSLMAGSSACMLDLDVPIWVSLYGSYLAELQAKAKFTAGAEMYIVYKWVREIMLRGDKFSAINSRQKYEAIGELAMLGRLNMHTHKYDFVDIVPLGIDIEDKYEHNKDVFRGKSIPDNAFVVLWSGGFNTWGDVDTLFNGISLAMSRSEKIHFVATGGSIPVHHEIGYEKFQQYVKESKYKDRFHLFGWIPQEEVPNFYFEANVGINVDLPIYEAYLGCRNRILNWMKAGLPAITTYTTELSEIIEQRRLGFVVPHSDPQKIADTICYLEANPDKLRQAGDRAREYILNERTYDITTREAIEWAKRPEFAPDNAARFQNKHRPLDKLDKIIRKEFK